MKLPNGFGSVYKLSGNRRKPYRAIVTERWQIGHRNRQMEAETQNHRLL